MSLYLNTINKNSSHKKKKRLGRGNSSGDGNYSGKGMKGQKSRSGVSGLKRMGMKQQLLKIPKLRGFKSSNPKNQVVNIDDLNDNFKDNEEVSPTTLIAKGLISRIKQPVKILGDGELTVKGLKFIKVKMSETVKSQISKK